MSSREGSGSPGVPGEDKMIDHERRDSPRNHKGKSYSRSPSRSRKVYRDGDRERRRGGDREDKRSRSRSHSRRNKSSKRSRSRSRSGGGGGGYRGRSYSHSPMSSRKRHLGTRDNPKPSRCIGIFGLSVYTTEDELYHLMSKYGPLERVQVVIDAKTGRSRGFAFVYFESSEDAKVAKDQCTGMKINGKSIRVDFSITERPHTPTPGIYMGKPTYRERDRYDSRRRSDRDDYYYEGGRSSRRRRSPSPYYSSSRRRRYSRSRSYSPRLSRGIG